MPCGLDCSHGGTLVQELHTTHRPEQVRLMSLACSTLPCSNSHPDPLQDCSIAVQPLLPGHLPIVLNLPCCAIFPMLCKANQECLANCMAVSGDISLPHMWQCQCKGFADDCYAIPDIARVLPFGVRAAEG